MFHRMKLLKVEMRERFALRKFTWELIPLEWLADLYCLVNPIIQEDIISFLSSQPNGGRRYNTTSLLP